MPGSNAAMLTRIPDQVAWNGSHSETLMAIPGLFCPHEPGPSKRPFGGAFSLSCSGHALNRSPAQGRAGRQAMHKGCGNGRACQAFNARSGKVFTAPIVFR
jgi:hypothetical protein